MDEKVSVSSLLRKAMVIAKKLKIEELEKWVSLEADGYPAGSELPEYRKVSSEAKSFNPYNGLWLPLMWANGQEPVWLRLRPIAQSIPELEDLVTRDDNGSLQMDFNPETAAALMKAADMVRPPVSFITKTSLIGIISKVRNLILEWTLRLENQGILGNDMTFTRTEIQSASANRGIIIENFQGIIGDVSNSTVTQNLTMSIKEGDFDSLADFLKSKGVDEVDVKTLEVALDADPKPKESGKFGTKVSQWMGFMLQKAAGGTWEIALGAAGGLLADAVSRYYGLK